MVFFYSQTVPGHKSQSGLHSWIGYGMGLFQIGHGFFVLFFLKKIETFLDIAGIYTETEKKKENEDKYISCIFKNIHCIYPHFMFINNL